jgi:hypothetical protein
VVIVAGGLLILRRLRLLQIAIGFWITFAAGLAVLAASGHSITARWHVGPVSGAYFWWILVTSPEVLVFLFFMITDPKTIPAGERGRRVYAVAVGALAVVLIAPMQTEFAAKVALLGALTIVCAAHPLVTWAWPRLPRTVPSRATTRTLFGAGLIGVFGALVVAAGIPARPSETAIAAPPLRRAPTITVVPPGKRHRLVARRPSASCATWSSLSRSRPPPCDTARRGARRRETGTTSWPNCAGRSKQPEEGRSWRPSIN